MKLSNEELNKIMMKADNDLDMLKDRCHDLYEENEELKKKCNMYEMNMYREANEKNMYKEQLQITHKDLENYIKKYEKVIEYIEKQKTKMYKSRNKIAMYVLMKVEDILKGDDK